jgi:hypothetical protein
MNRHFAFAAFILLLSLPVDVTANGIEERELGQTALPTTVMPGMKTQPSLQADSSKVSIDTTDVGDVYFALPVDSSWWHRDLQNLAFGVGERLEFDVKYGKLPAGSAVMEIPETVTYDNRICFRITSTANSNSIVSVFYKVRDSVETIVDTDGIFPRRFSKKLREGGYRIDRTTIIDQKEHLAITGNDTIPTYAFVQDPLSSLYFIRTQELVPGKDVFIDNHTDKKNYPLKVIVRKKEHVKVPAGEFDCIMIEPVMRAEGIFKAKGNIRIWLTDDQYKMPVMMKSEVYFLGSISAQLSKYDRGQIEAKLE